MAIWRTDVEAADPGAGVAGALLFYPKGAAGSERLYAIDGDGTVLRMIDDAYLQAIALVAKPDGNNTRDLGSGSFNFKDGYFQRLLIQAGALATPSLASSADLNTGVDWPGADVLRFITGGVQRGSFDASGNFIVVAKALVGNTSSTGNTLEAYRDGVINDGSQNALSLNSLTTPAKKLYMGYSLAQDGGYIQANHDGVTVKTLYLNQQGGLVYIGGPLSLPAQSRVRANNSVAQNFGPGATAVVTLDAESGDTNAMHDGAGLNPERVTIPAGHGGTYLIVAEGTIADLSGVAVSAAFRLRKLAGTVDQRTISWPANSISPVFMTYLDTPVAGDYYDVQVQNSGGGSLSVSVRLTAMRLF